eukprot:699814_1
MKVTKICTQFTSRQCPNDDPDDANALLPPPHTNKYNPQILNRTNRHLKKTKYGNYGDYRRRSDRIKTTTNYDDAQFGDDVIIDTDEDQEPSDHHMDVTSHESDVQMEDEEEDDEIQSDESTPNDEANHNNNGTNVFFASNLIRNHRTIRTILNNDELNEEEMAFKGKAYQYVNDYFESNLRQSKQLWMDQKHKY